MKSYLNQKYKKIKINTNFPVNQEYSQGIKMILASGERSTALDTVKTSTRNETICRKDQFKGTTSCEP